MQKFLPMSRFLAIIPLLVLVVIFVSPTTTFALAPSGAGNQHHAASPSCGNPCLVEYPATSPCPQCQGKFPLYGHSTTVPSCADDGRFVASAPITGGTLYLVYSDFCGTNWAVVVGSVGGLISNANVTRADGVREDGTWVPGDGIVYSPMVYAPVLAARACGSINNWPGGCTAWV